ncbi:MAG: class I SAM-dependent methyltransferase [Rhizobiales bacterium]|nr:class I SAM-dependent methyltransferase [Hyphomicrobiales bacterium]
MEKLLSSAFARLVRNGALRVTYASGRVAAYGEASQEPVAIRFADAGAERAVALDPALKLGEMFMDGRLMIEEGSVFDLVSLLKRNGLRRLAAPHVAALAAFRTARERIAGAVTPEAARRNVAHHYDLEAGLFELFLDPDRQYSCAYFEDPEQSLEAAQLAKKRHIAAKLLLEPGAHVLDIGCGWGGLALYLAEVAGAKVTGITLSEEQLAIANRRAAEQGLSERVTFRLEDYRRVSGPFDRIVSVGMFEHVGRKRYPAFFRQAASLLERRHGVILLHAIGRPRPIGAHQPFVEKYIFPGGYAPALSEVLPAAEQAGLLVKDLEILPMHYAWTLKAWRERFVANWDKAAALYDERFCRMWEFYLAAFEAAFRHDRLFIFQLQLARHQDAVPFRRDYIGEAEAALRRQEQALAVREEADHAPVVRASMTNSKPAHR